MISVIIPAYNAEKTISSTLKALLNQNYPKNKYEIIVVDDESTDNTVETVKKFKRVKLIEQKHKGPAIARNLGAKKAKDNILLFIDSDCIPDKNWIKNIVKPFKNKEIVGVSGTYRTLNKDKIIARFAGYEIEERHKAMEKLKYIDFIGTYSAGYRKKTFLKFGGFDESFPSASGEDPELSFRLSEAGLKMLFQPKAFVYHYHPDTLWKFLKQKFWRGYWRVFVYTKRKKKFLKHSYTPRSLLLEEALTGITCLLLFFTVFNLVPLIFGLLFLILTFLLTLPFSIKIFLKDKVVGIISPFIIFLRNFFTGIGIVYGIASLLLIKIKGEQIK